MFELGSVTGSWHRNGRGLRERKTLSRTQDWNSPKSRGREIGMLYSETIGFTDPYPYQRSIRAADLQVLPTAKGPFRAELKKIVLGKLWAQQAREDSPRVWAGTFGHGRAVIGFLSDAGQPALQHCGMELPHGAIIVSNARSIHQRSEAGCRWSSMTRVGL